MGGGSPRLTAFLFLFPESTVRVVFWPCQWRAMERALLRQRPQHRVIESRSCAEPTEIEILRSLLQRWTKRMHGWPLTRQPLVQLRPWRGNRSMLLRLPWSWTTLPSPRYWRCTKPVKPRQRLCLSHRSILRRSHQAKTTPVRRSRQWQQAIMAIPVSAAQVTTTISTSAPPDHLRPPS